MRRTALSLLSILTLILGLLGGFTTASATGSGDVQKVSPNVDRITVALVKSGRIPATASDSQKEALTRAYLQTKLKTAANEKEGNALARKQIDANEEILNASPSDLRGRKFGNTSQVASSGASFKPLVGTDKLLLILVEFSDSPFTWTPNGASPRTTAGPLHNQMPVPDNDWDFWVPDFSVAHFQGMMFTPGGWRFPADSPRYANESRGSMRDYYLEQSYGKYTVDGQTFGWYRVEKPEAYYGDDNPAGGSDNLLPGTTKTLISDVVSVINSSGNQIPWSEYDTNGDCVIDHPLFVHAGIDQSGGGGAQGDDAIWAHSSSTSTKVATTDACPTGLFIANYTIMPEDGSVGVFAHEFGHDLGLPDEYDTIYSGSGESVSMWSLMSSGSWLGMPHDSQPSDISIWGRYALGWLAPGENLAVTSLASLQNGTATVRLEQAERWAGPGTYNAIRVSLPPKAYYINAPHTGSFEWFGGKADQIDTTLRRAVDLTGQSSATLTFWTWYDIEEDWDFGFVQVSTDGGATWTSLPIAGTTSSIVDDGMPSIAANMPGFTGSSGGWVQKTADLSAYAGQSILLQFRYMTDWGTTMAGFYVDDISVTANGTTIFADSVDAADPAWTADGWALETGSGTKTHYYMLEWRNLNDLATPYGGSTIVNFDAGLRNVYQFDPYAANPNQPTYFTYNPGLLLWYRDMSYTDNWTGVHPGRGFLLVVDSHPEALLRPRQGIPWTTKVQTRDSTFSLSSVPSMLIGYFGALRLFPQQAGVPAFNDSHSYWSSKVPSASAKTPTYGLVFRVLGQALDGSAAILGLGTK